MCGGGGEPPPYTPALSNNPNYGDPDLHALTCSPLPLLVLQALRGVMFGDFMVPGADPRVYTEIKEQSLMMRAVQDYLADFNATSKKPMNLVIFQFVLEHICRICRIITSPGGREMIVTPTPPLPSPFSSSSSSTPTLASLPSFCLQVAMPFWWAWVVRAVKASLAWPPTWRSMKSSR